MEHKPTDGSPPNSFDDLTIVIQNEKNHQRPVSETRTSKQRFVLTNPGPFHYELFVQTNPKKWDWS